MIRVTVTDLQTGDGETQEIENDYIVVTAGNRYVDSTIVHANGTHIITIKREKR